MKTYVHLWSYLAQFFLEWMFETKVVEEIKTPFLCSITHFVDDRALYENNMEKYCRASAFHNLHAIPFCFWIASLCFLFCRFFRPAQSAIKHLPAPSAFLSDFEFVPCVQNRGPLLQD